MRTRFVLLLLFLTTAAHGQPLPSPAEFLGYELGEQFTPHHRVVEYFRQIAAQSDRVVLEPYGQTYEGRPLFVVYVGRPDRLQARETIRTDHLRRAGLLEGTPAEESTAIVWLGYNVHGNEAVSTEASMATLFDLARPNHRSAPWLDDVLVIMDPCVNPDGRDRYVNWYRQTVGRFPNADPAAREHAEPWPGGRSNHYNFDLNRDWAWQTQKETIARVALYNRWMPHIAVDFHEQGVDSPYYFAPAAEPYHEAVTDWQRALQDSIGTNHARYFDREGWLYFTREVFDLLYPGYGDSYPTFNGAIGMTYEQGGSGRAGLRVETAEGDTLTLGDRIAHHHTTGLSTVEVAARQRSGLVSEFVRFHERALSQPPGPWRTFALDLNGGRDRLAAMAAHLDRLGIRYGTVAAPREVSGLDYRTGTQARRRLEPGDLVVSTRQAKGLMAKVLMEPRTVIADSLTYDITAWALPYAYNLDGLAIEAEIPADARFATEHTAWTGSGRPYAYGLRWTSPADVAFLADVLREGLSARVQEAAFTTGGVSYGAGTVLFTRAGNESLGDRFDAVLREAAQEHGRSLAAFRTGKVQTGSDFGSNRVRFLRAPRVAVATGESVSSSSAGEIWHYFDQVIGYPVTMVPAERLGGLDLDSYDVLILPSGNYRFSDDERDRLLGWVRGGGRLVALERALGAFAGRDGFTLARRDDDDDDDDDEEDAEPAVYAERIRESVRDDVPGAVFRTRVDTTHPLAFGLNGGYYTLRRSSTAYEYLKDGWNVGVLERGARLAGQVGSEAVADTEEVLAFGVQDAGRGQIVYFVDDPLYRGFWHEGRLLFANAVFMVGR